MCWEVLPCFLCISSSLGMHCCVEGIKLLEQDFSSICEIRTKCVSGGGGTSEFHSSIFYVNTLMGLIAIVSIRAYNNVVAR